MSHFSQSVSSPSDAQTFHWSDWVVCPGKHSWNWLLALLISFLFFGGHMSSSGNELEIYRKSVGTNQDIVVLQGPYHPPTVLDGLLKINGEHAYLGSTEIRVEVRTGSEVATLWSSLVGVGSDPGKERSIYILDLIVREDYFVMVTHNRHYVMFHKVYPFGNRSRIAGATSSPFSRADSERVDFMAADWAISSVFLDAKKGDEIGVDVKALPNNRFSLTIKDMRVGPPDPDGSGWEYPVFEQDEAGKWDFKLKRGGPG